MNQDIKLDILAFGSHPDDVELAASGTILKHIALGKSVGVIDLTLGEMATRGNVEGRIKEVNISSKILGLNIRENLDLGDCFFEVQKKELIKVIQQIRRFQPDIVLCNATMDRHPDHARGGELVSRACYLAGLRKIKTSWENNTQQIHRPNAVYHYIQDHWIDPDFIVDVSDYFNLKLEAIKSYKSQFFNPESNEPTTPISTESFLKSIEAKGITLGRYINADYGEGFTCERFIGVKDITTLI